MNIAFFEIQGWERSLIEKTLKGHTISFFKESLSERNIQTANNAEIISVFIYSELIKELITRLPNLRLITTRSTGFDHIDIEECRKRGITVTNVPNYGENTVAEFTFALMLALSRKTIQACIQTQNNIFSLENLKGFDLKGKTLGVIGTGRIGKHVIKIARGFEMNVLAYDIYPSEGVERELGFTYVSLTELLKKSDIITLHTFYTKENHHFIDKKAFSLMKRGAILINTARGPLIDTNALIDALNKKIIAAAALDVLEDETLLKTGKLSRQDKQLLKNENVIITPHVAFYTQEALERIMVTTLSIISDFTHNTLKRECIVS